MQLKILPMTLLWRYLFAGILLLAGGSGFAQSAHFDPGAGRFTFADLKRSIPVWTYLPDGVTHDAPILFVMHGWNRNGRDYRNAWMGYAAQHKALLLVPEFSERDFPGSIHYSLGNMKLNTDGTMNTTETTFAILERLFDYVVKTTGNHSKGYRIYGHSAGAQLVHRMILFTPTSRAELAVAANAGWYTLPDFSIRFPYGLQDSGLTEAVLKKAFEKKFMVLLGEGDTDPYHPSLRRTAEAMKQGEDRYQRGVNFFYTAKETASRLNAPFSWELKTVAKAGHSDAAMASAAAEILFPK